MIRKSLRFKLITVGMAATQVNFLGINSSVESVMKAYDYLGATMKRLGANYETIVLTDSKGVVYAMDPQNAPIVTKSLRTGTILRRPPKAKAGSAP